MLIEFEHDGRHYKLEFNKFNIACIIGDSAVGKSLMCSDLNKLRDYNPKYRHIKPLNINDEDTYISLLRDENSYKKFSTFIIDNADILVTDEVSEIIENHRNTYWILIGRVIPPCVPSMTCIGVLKRNKNTFEIDYKNVF